MHICYCQSFSITSSELLLQCVHFDPIKTAQLQTYIIKQNITKVYTCQQSLQLYPKYRILIHPFLYPITQILINKKGIDPRNTNLHNLDSCTSIQAVEDSVMIIFSSSASCSLGESPVSISIEIAVTLTHGLVGRSFFGFVLF